MQVTTIGLDLAKNVFQVHGVTNEGEVAFNRSLRRAQVLKFFKSVPPCLVGIEACGTSHYWAREITKLGHEVRLVLSDEFELVSVRPVTLSFIPRKVRATRQERRCVSA